MCTASQSIVNTMNTQQMGHSGDGTPLSGYVPAPVLDFSRDYIQQYHLVVLLVLVILIVYVVWSMSRKAAESFMPTATMRAQQMDDAAQASGHRDLIGRAIMTVGNAPAHAPAHAYGHESMAGGQGKGHGAAATDSGVAAIGALQGLPPVTSSTDPSSPLFPGSASWQVLHSPAFNCGGRDLQASSNAWGWMTKVAKGEAMTSRPTDDSDFSKIAAGL